MSRTGERKVERRDLYLFVILRVIKIENPLLSKELSAYLKFE